MGREGQAHEADSHSEPGAPVTMADAQRPVGCSCALPPSGVAEERISEAFVGGTGALAEPATVCELLPGTLGLESPMPRMSPAGRRTRPSGVARRTHCRATSRACGLIPAGSEVARWLSMLRTRLLSTS
ncbi:hypothetical protein DNK56_34105 [Streptomyces sp. AC1-42W]|nr:hypothetical protein DNK55_30970 [Streptomyces sp. AC1-42T]PZT73279.1 hypothetical protein DNK56_34105 [Streptomyces sp. AC1-42W]